MRSTCASNRQNPLLGSGPKLRIEALNQGRDVPSDRQAGSRTGTGRIQNVQRTVHTGDGEILNQLPRIRTRVWKPLSLTAPALRRVTAQILSQALCAFQHWVEASVEGAARSWIQRAD